MAVAEQQSPVGGRRADNGEGAAFAPADRRELVEPRRWEGQDVAFLRLVAPDLGRRHARLLDRHGAQLEVRAAAGAVGEFRQRVRDAAGADIVQRQDRVAVTGCRTIARRCSELPATIDDLLRTPLHFRVAALYRGEVEILGVAAGAHRTGGAAAETDQHARAAELDEQRSRWQRARLERLRGGDVADAAGDHDRFVVPAQQRHVRSAGELFVAAEEAGEVRAAEFVVERRGADRALEHDRQR